MRGILGSLFTMLACLSFGWSCACRADLILFRPAPCFGDRCVVDCGFDSGSTELLNRYEDTFAIHGIQLTGAWNHTCIIELHGSVYLGAELPVDADGSATGVELIACSIFSDPFRIVQPDIRHRVPIEELKFLDQTSLMEPSAMTPLWLATRVEAK